jgi:hypothetical protein
VTFSNDEQDHCSLVVDDVDGRCEIRIPIEATVALRDFFMKISANGPQDLMSVTFDTVTGKVEAIGDHL